MEDMLWRYFMKDYSMNDVDRQKFILSYEVIEDSIVNDQIIINLATGEHYTVPYTCENEKKILEIMKGQVLDSEEFEKKQEKIFSNAWKCGAIDIIFLILDVILLLTGIASNLIIAKICIGLLAMAGIFEAFGCVDCKLKIRDIHKNRIFINNEVRLNKNFKYDKNDMLKQNLLSNTKVKTRKIVEDVPGEKPTFTLNTVDKIGYSDLKQIIDNTKRNEEFGFDYSNEQQCKTKLLVKTRSDKK
jgi:hypothetical protein